MTKTLTLLVAGTAIAVAVIAAPTAAEAQWRRGPGFVGGLFAGAIIGGALAGPYGYGYYPRPYGYYRGPVYGPGPCVRPVWNGYRWVRAYAC
jgi:hypothetical protein